MDRGESRRVEKTAPRMAPAIGQHTRAILEEFGLDDAAIEALTEDA